MCLSLERNASTISCEIAILILIVIAMNDFFNIKNIKVNKFAIECMYYQKCENKQIRYRVHISSKMWKWINSRSKTCTNKQLTQHCDWNSEHIRDRSFYHTHYHLHVDYLLLYFSLAVNQFHELIVEEHYNRNVKYVDFWARFWSRSKSRSWIIS